MSRIRAFALAIRLSNATIDSHARDAEAGIAFLKTQKEVDARRIGHSEGGILAAIVASRSKDVAFVVSLAGTGLPGAEINPLQVEATLRADGKVSDDGITAIVASQRKLMKLIAASARDTELEAALRDALETAQKYAPTDEAKATAQKELGATLSTLKLPWFKSFVTTEPAVFWSKVTVPVLALNGDKDTQVPSKANLPAIKVSLDKAHNKDVDCEELAGLNHLFQPAKTGLLAEYAQIETTFDEKALDIMTTWLKKRALLAR